MTQRTGMEIVLSSGNTPILLISFPLKYLFKVKVVGLICNCRFKSPSLFSNQIVNLLHKNSSATVDTGEEERCKIEGVG